MKFARQNDLTGIYGDYKFPNNMSATECEDYYTWGHSKTAPPVIKEYDLSDTKGSASSPEYLNVLNDVWDELKKLNPELENVKIHDHKSDEVYYAFLGATSCFVPDDINSFLDYIRQDKAPYQEMCNDPKTGALVRWIEERSEGRIHWAASLSTLRNIQDQMRTPKNRHANRRP